MQVWDIELSSQKYVRYNDYDMKVMVVDMKIKFAKYWNEYSVVLAMVAV